jgi:hypothetical protein
MASSFEKSLRALMQNLPAERVPVILSRTIRYRGQGLDLLFYTPVIDQGLWIVIQQSDPHTEASTTQAITIAHTEINGPSSPPNRYADGSNLRRRPRIRRHPNATPNPAAEARRSRSPRRHSSPANVQPRTTLPKPTTCACITTTG